MRRRHFVRPRHPGLALAALVALTLGCNHTTPVTVEDPERGDHPFQPAAPVRLTFNPFKDLMPRFAPELGGLLYTYETSDLTRRDRCLGLMPATGGARVREVCAVSGGSLDSLDAYGPAALSPGGRIAYVASASTELKRGPDRSVLVVAPWSDPLDTTRVHGMPQDIGGIKVDGLTDLRWLDDDHLVYIAQRVDYPRYCNGCDRDTVRTGLGIVVADLSGSPSFTVVGGPRFVTSLAVADDGAFFYTLAGDSRVYRESPPGGPATVVHDFGTAGMARSIDVMGTMLSAVAGVKGSFVDWPGLGLTVFDSGGTVHVVDLGTGATVFRSAPQTTSPWPVPGETLFQRAVFVSPTALVVEAWPLDLIPNASGTIDSVLNGEADLWWVRFRP